MFVCFGVYGCDLVWYLVFTCCFDFLSAWRVAYIVCLVVQVLFGLLIVVVCFGLLWLFALLVICFMFINSN